MSNVKRDRLEAATVPYIQAIRRGANGGKFMHGKTFINDHFEDWVNPDPDAIQSTIGIGPKELKKVRSDDFWESISDPDEAPDEK